MVVMCTCGVIGVDMYVRCCGMMLWCWYGVMVVVWCYGVMVVVWCYDVMVVL